MKRILLLLTLLLAPSAFADDAVTSFGWNSVTSTFQAKLAALGWKNVPDQIAGYGYVPASFGATGGGTATVGGTTSLDWVKTGRQFHISGMVGITISGTVSTVTFALPNGYTCDNATRAMSDYWSTAQLCYTYIQPGTGTFTVGAFSTSTGTGANFVAGSGSCGVSLSCVTKN